jgi:hypothetical protein
LSAPPGRLAQQHEGNTQHASTATGLRVGRRLELAARVQIHQYIKAAPADGMGWH